MRHITKVPSNEIKTAALALIAIVMAVTLLIPIINMMAIAATGGALGFLIGFVWWAASGVFLTATGNMSPTGALVWALTLFLCDAL